MDNFLTNHTLSKCSRDQIDNVNSPITTRYFEFTVYKLPKENLQISWFQWQSTHSCVKKKVNGVTNCSSSIQWNVTQWIKRNELLSHEKVEDP